MAARVLGPRVALPALVLLALAALPGTLAILVTGADASRGVVTAAIVWAVLAGGASGGRPVSGALRWAVPPALRAIEFGGLLWIAAVAGPSSYPAAFALLFAVAFHHYDIVYGTRHRGRPMTGPLQAVAGGWDGRLLAAVVLLLAGALPEAFYAAAIVLGVLFVSESVIEWRRVGPAQGKGAADAEPGEDDEEDEAV